MTSPQDAKKVELNDIKPNFMVYAKSGGQMAGAAGRHIGTVDRREGDTFVKLKDNDSADGKPRWIPLSWIERTDYRAVYLNVTEEDFRRNAINTLPNGADIKKAV